MDRFGLVISSQSLGNCSVARFGSTADIPTKKSNVRFTPKSGHLQCNSPFLLCANSGHHADESFADAAWRRAEDSEERNWRFS
jgi:hypothetical protein